MRTAGWVLAAAALALQGCRHREITSLERKQAAEMVSEAEFATTVHEWPRAEGLYASAATLCPDTGDIWVNLGIVRMHLGNRSGAKSAYGSALDAYKADCARDPTDSQALLRRVYVLAILGRADDARALVNEARSRNPGDRTIRIFVENGELDRMVADPGLREISP